MKKYHGDNFWKITKMHKLINEWKSNDEPKDVIKGNKKNTQKIFLPPTTRSSVRMVALEVVRKKAFSSLNLCSGTQFSI